MLEITIGGTDVFDEGMQMFRAEGGVKLRFEHSLVSLSKWESIYEKPFIDTKSKTPEETLSYIECMVISPNPPGDFLHQLSEENVETINAYIERKMTATWFSNIEPKTRNSEAITAELIYYWMTVFNIPFECENWHLNRLFTLIRICNIKQEKPKEMSRAELAARNRELNALRKAQLGTTG